MKKIMIALLIFAFGAKYNAISQSKGDDTFGIYAFLTPTKIEYGKDFLIDDDFMKIGYGFGIEKTNAIGSFGLGWVTSVSIIIQQFDKDKTDDVYGVIYDDYKFKSVLNIPILTGLKFQKNITDGFGLYGQAQIGLNVLRIGGRELEDNGSTLEREYEIKPLLGYNFAGGVIIKDHINIGVRYFKLGEPEVEATDYDSNVDGTTKVTLEKIKLNMFCIVLGYNF